MKRAADACNGGMFRYDLHPSLMGRR
jgi:hypothetical protein